MTKTLLICVGLVGCAILMCGCEWTSGGGVDTWNTSQNGDWADFSGTYKAASGSGALVRAYTVITSTNQVTDQQLGVGDGSTTAFAGNLGHLPERSTLTIIAGGYHFTDPGSGGTNAGGTINLAVTPADGSVGSFNFGTYSWTLSFPAPIAAGTPILASYYYMATSPDQGNHGTAIYSFVIYQTGNNLHIIDSNNGAYDGHMGAISGTTNSSAAQASFSVTGASQGYAVTIVGTLQGTVSSGLLSSRLMKATFVEEGGYDADINAVAQ